jgi:hypothetical protein
MHLLGLVWRDGAKKLMIASGCEVHQLPCAGEIGRNFRSGNILDEHAEEPLIEAMREAEFLSDIAAAGSP